MKLNYRTHMKDKNNRKLVGVYLLYNSDEIRELKKKNEIDRYDATK